jgi:hypothetical protein
MERLRHEKSAKKSSSQQQINLFAFCEFYGLIFSAKKRGENFPASLQINNFI